MINSVYVDFAKTFGKGLLLGIEPKMTRADKNDPKSPQVQAHDNNGNLKWTATVAVQTQSFENKKYENIAITIHAPKKPYEAIPPGHAVIIEGLEMGIMKQDRSGFSIYFSAENIRPAPQERVASGQ